MTLLLRLAERALNRPLLIHPDKVPFLLAVLEGRIPIGNIAALKDAATAHVSALPEGAQRVMRGPAAPVASRFVGDEFEADESGRGGRRLPYRRTSEGIAVITVTGTLINRGAWIGSFSGETSYEGIKHQVASALADPKVSAILLDIESPGGEAVGAFEAAEAIRNAAKEKPVVAVANGMAASAAYALASGARRIVTTPTGIVGSIGVVMLHADFSRQLDKAGITPTLIFAGAHKVDGNPFEPLNDSVREDLQREVMQFYDLFVATVAAGRCALSPAAIRGTEARIFIGEEAVAAGLADAVGTFESVLADLTATARTRASKKGLVMNDKSGLQPGAENPGNAVTLEAHNAVIEKVRAEGKAEGLKEGAAAERARLAAILADDKIRGRERAALDLATKSPAMQAEDVIAFVAAHAGAAIPTIAERMGGQGADLALGGPIARPAKADGGWGKVIAQTNKSRGFAA